VRAPAFPQSYENRAAAVALDRLIESPGEATLGALLDAALRGGLTVDVTGSPSAKDLRLRTLQTTDGQQVLPLFTSMKELKATADAAGLGGTKVNGIIVPGRQALGFIETADFVAVQFNPRLAGGIVAREHVLRALAS
jgi:hypothetical protein